MKIIIALLATINATNVQLLVGADPGKAGAACDDTKVCASGLYCPKTDKTGDKKCTPDAKDGEACSDDIPCSIGLDCKDGKCAAKTPATPGKVGEDCSADKPCEDTLYCSKDKKVCTEKGKAGADCDTDKPCAADLECKDKKCAAKTPATPGKKGEACDD